MSIMNLNANTYEATVGTSSVGFTLTYEDTPSAYIIIHNSGTTPVFVLSGLTAPTAVFPTSATAPLDGAIIGAGSTQTYYKNLTHGFLAAIRGSGSGDIYITVGSGE
jgi:hypothetical protein